MEIIKDIRNELFKRNELSLKLESEKNPSFDEIKTKISEDLKKPEENIDVYNIKGGFGKNEFIIDINIYDSKEDLDNIKKLELTSKQRKDNAKPSEEKPIEDKPVEKSKDEKVEDKVEEEKIEGTKNEGESKPKEVENENTDSVEDTKEIKPEETSVEGEAGLTPDHVEEEASSTDHVEDKPEEEEKAVEEEEQKEEEAKE